MPEIPLSFSRTLPSCCRALWGHELLNNDFMNFWPILWASWTHVDRPARWSLESQTICSPNSNFSPLTETTSVEFWLISICCVVEKRSQNPSLSGDKTSPMRMHFIRGTHLLDRFNWLASKNARSFTHKHPELSTANEENYYELSVPLITGYFRCLDN